MRQAKLLQVTLLFSFYFYLSKKLDISCEYQVLFSLKKKYIFNMSSAAVVNGALRVNKTYPFVNCHLYISIERK